MAAAGALTATAGGAPQTPPMGAYPPATPPPTPRAQPPRRRRMKPLVLALILGGIVGAGGATAFVVNSIEPAARPDGAAGGADVPGDGARVREPGGCRIDLPVRLTQPVFVGEFGTVHGHVPVGASQHVLIPGHTADHDADVRDTDHVSDTDEVHVDVHVDVGFGVRIDLFLRAREHGHVISPALVAFVRVHHHFHLSQHPSVPADLSAPSS